MGTSLIEGQWVEPASGRRLAYRLWQPPQPQVLVVVVHGFAEHGGRYAAMAEALAARGIAVGVQDLWGHGRSGGSRGELGRLEDCARDLQGMTEAVLLPRSGAGRYAVFGHSFGGMAAIVWALQAPGAFQRMVLQSPLIDTGFQPPRWKTWLAGWLAGWWPRFQFYLDLDARALSHDPAVVRAYREDPLVHNAMSAGTYQSIKAWQRRILARPGDVRPAVLLLYGTGDRVVSIETAKQWYEGVVSEKRSVIFPDYFHELHHEAVRDDIIRLVADWVAADRPPGHQ